MIQFLDILQKYFLRNTIVNNVENLVKILLYKVYTDYK